MRIQLSDGQRAEGLVEEPRPPPHMAGRSQSQGPSPCGFGGQGHWREGGLPLQDAAKTLRGRRIGLRPTGGLESTHWGSEASRPCHSGLKSPPWGSRGWP